MQIPFHATEEKIIRAYLRICYRRGFEKITLEKLAKESKVSLASVRYHFGHKNKTLEDSTLLYVLSDGYAFIEKFLDQEKKKSTYKALRSYVNANFAWMKAFPEQSTFLLYYFYLLATPNRERISQVPYLARARERIEEMYYSDCGRGRLKPAETAKEFVLHLHSSLVGAMIVAAIENTKTSHDAQRLWVLSQIPYLA